MAIAHTRGLLRAALDGSLAGVPMRQDPNFGFLVPESCADIPANVLDPRGTWPDKNGYDEVARNLRGRFEHNFAVYEPFVDSEVKRAAIRAAA
jgi:phosphoenolpyruvate carboxykinase (ATP)